MGCAAILRDAAKSAAPQRLGMFARARKFFMWWAGGSPLRSFRLSLRLNDGDRAQCQPDLSRYREARSGCGTLLAWAPGGLLRRRLRLGLQCEEAHHVMSDREPQQMDAGLDL